MMNMRRGLMVAAAMLIVVLCGTGALFVKADSLGESQSDKEYTEIPEAIQSVVDDYFDFRSCQFLDNDIALRNMLEAKLSAITEATLAKRSTAIKTYCEQVDITIIQVETSYEICDVNMQNHIYECNLYESSKILYRCNGYDIVEEMGTGCLHKLIIEEKGTDIVIVCDYFDETFPFGVACQEENSNPTYMFAKGETELNQWIEPNSPNEPVTHYYPGYSTSAAISYSNTYWQNYNSSYATEVWDCCNFVSQCIYAGGVSYVNYAQYSSGWYYSTGGSLAWVRVSAFDSFWRAQGIARKSGTTYMFPGNPVYWLNPPTASSSGHMMICVGYNASGTPTVNAHNADVYHVPITNYDSSYNAPYYTLLFYCDHDWVVTAGMRRCNICGSREVFLED